MMIEELDRKIRNKIENKQVVIVTDINIREFGYIHSGKQNGIQKWQSYTPRIKNTLKMKIENKQNHISTNEDIGDRGYRKSRKEKNGTQIWERIEYGQKYHFDYREKNKEHLQKKSKEWYENHKEEKLKANKKWLMEHEEEQKKYQLEYSRTPKRKTQISKYYFNHQEGIKKRHNEYYQSHKEEHREYYRKYNVEHKNELKEKARIYRQTPQGKLSSRKASSKHRKKGFILLFELENIGDIETDFHHISEDLPFVIPVPREIHQSIHGSNPNHYSGVTIKFCEWLKEHPEIKIKDKLI